ncbi:MAG: hypothetical protein R6U04_12610 [Bacteroidales bacterium]
MKKLLLIYIYLFSVLLSMAQEAEKPYDFPVKPGTSEWSKLKNNKEKVGVCQIPDNQLKLLSTKDLLETCLNYPLLGDIMAFSNIQDGFNKFKNDFNGINELLQRKDASEILIAKYKMKRPSDYDNNWTLVRKGKFSFEFSIIEIFISQKEIISQLDYLSKVILIKELLEKYYKKTDNIIFGSLSYTTSAFCIVRILESENLIKDISNKKTKNNIVQFSKNGNNLDKETFTNIILFAEQITNN